MKLLDLIKSVREENLTKDQLESYQTEISNLFAQMQIEMADLEKEEAIFIEKSEGSVAQKKVTWKATPSGQRLIVLKRYATATRAILGSIKSRLYSIY